MECFSCGTSNQTSSPTCMACGEMLGRLRLDVLETTREGGLLRERPRLLHLVESASRPIPAGNGGSSKPASYAPGRSFGARYTILDRIGQGGMGVVYKAYDRELERTVALKMIREDQATQPEALQRFRRELGLAQQVTHPNVCRLHDLGESDGIRYLSMEYLEGPTLADVIAQSGGLSLRRAIDVTDQICAGLEAIHAQSIVHRDLKPTNIAVTPGGRAVVMDFGLARRPFDSELTAPGVMVGSLAYIAPEQVGEREPDARTDIYALGLLLYEMLTGRRPPGDRDRNPRPLALRGEHAPCAPPSRLAPGTPRAMDALVMKCLAWDPANRPQSVVEVRAALREIAEATEPQRKNVERLPRLLSQVARTWRTWVALASVALAPVVWLLARDVVIEPFGPKTIAVLPFRYEGNVPEQSYLGTLVADAFVALLQSVRGIEVAPLASVQGFGDDVAPAEAARTLNVSRVLHGTVFSEKGELVVKLVLTSAKGETLLEKTLQGTIARPYLAIESAKKPILAAMALTEPSSGPSLEQLRSPSPEAYRKYIEARRLHEAWDVSEDLAGAIRLYREAIREDRDFAAAHAGLALALVTEFYQKREAVGLASARESAERAAALSPELPEVLIASGFVEEASGNSVQAERAYKSAIERSPGNDRAICTLASFYADHGEPAEARSLYAQAVSLRPNDWRNHYALGRLLVLKMGNVAEGRQHLERASELSKGPAPLVLSGVALLNAGRLDEAQSMFEESLKRSPTPPAQYMLGLVHYYKNEYELALRNWHAVLAKVPNKAAYHTAVGDAFRQLGDSQQARASYGTALKLLREAEATDPRDSEVRAELALTLAATEQCEPARGGIEKLLSEYPESSYYAYLATYIARLCGDDQKAIQLALAAIEKKSVLGVRYDPDLAPLRQVPEVRRALERAGFPVP